MANLTPPNVRTTTKSAKEQQAADAQRRWDEGNKEAWAAIRGMWADRKIDAVAYQRRLRRERKQPGR